jgi:hypothetical protein
MSPEVFERMFLKQRGFSAFPVKIGMDNKYGIRRGTLILHHTMLSAELSKTK